MIDHADSAATPTSAIDAEAAPVELNDASLIPPDPGAGCPPPLSWNDVLNSFRTDSVRFETEATGFIVRGHVLGQGPPLYFLNGICATPELFCLLVWLLKDDFRCVVLDYPSEARTMSELGSVPFIAADHLGDKEFDVYATSFGTAVAIESLIANGNRIPHVVLQGPLVSLRLSMAERVAAGVLRFTPGIIDRLPLRRRVLQSNHQRWFPPIDQTRWQFFEQETGAVPMSDVAHRARMLDRIDYSNRISECSTPALIVSSEGEAARYREAAELFADRHPNARHEHIPNTGHVPFVTHPHRMANLIRPFLRDESPE